MEFGIHIEPEGAGYDEIARLAAAVEDAGFDVLSRSDHYLPHERPVAPLRPTDAWATMAGLARETVRVQLSVLMSNPSFRHPAALAVILSQVDDMSNGRIELGLGAGWFQRELDLFGFSMPDVQEERYLRRREQIAVLKGIWAATESAPFNFAGEYYSIDANTGLGSGESRRFPRLVLALTDDEQTIRDAVEHADECNAPFATAEETADQFRRVDEACARLGREAESLKRSATVLVCTGTTDADIKRRAEVIGTGTAHVETAHFVGSPAQVVEGLKPFLDLGLSRMYVQVRDSSDLDHIKMLSDLVRKLEL